MYYSVGDVHREITFSNLRKECVVNIQSVR